MRHGLSRLKIYLRSKFSTKGEESMTQQQYIINRKLNIVELAQTLGNISEACRNLGVSRQHYYDIKSAISEDGLEGQLIVLVWTVNGTSLK